MWTGGATIDFYPVAINQPAGSLFLMADAAVTDSQMSSNYTSTIWQLSLIGTSDFVPRLFKVV
jgi:hypothetical protein